MIRKVLIIKGADVCYDIMNYMAERLGEALSKLDCDVIYYDIISEGFSGLMEHVGKSYFMIIGFQTGLFSFLLPESKGFIFDYLEGPIFNFLFDHPIFHYQKLKQVPKNYYVLTHDRNYSKFISDYYHNVKKTFILPPGGTVPICNNKKKLDVVFMGTYRNYRTFLDRIRKSSRKHLSNRFLLELRRQYNTTPEDVLSDLLESENVELSDDEFLEGFDDLKYLIECVNAYYREKIIEFLLKNEIEINVYGESWKRSPFATNNKLVIRHEVSPKQSLEVYEDAKCSLNIMTWHKDGYTERIVNSMFAHSVVVSDRTTSLEERFEDGKEIILFDIKKLDLLYHQLKAILNDALYREMIAENAYKRVTKEDTWYIRAETLVNLATKEKNME